MKRPFNRIVEVYLFAFAFLFASRPLSDADFWFHLKTGEYIVNTGLIPKQEIFSFTSYGSPWIAHGWLSGALFYVVYSRVGFNLLIFLFALLATLAFWLVFKRLDTHIVIKGFATLLGVWAVRPNLGVRPRVFSLLFASIFLAVLTHYARTGKGKAVWLLVALMILWVNLHGGFVIGLLLIGFTIVGVLLDGWNEGLKTVSLWPRLRTLSLVLLGCLAAVAINPYGLQMYGLPLEVMRTPVFQATVVDFLSPNFHQREILPFSLLALLTIGALALSPKKVRPSSLLLFLATLYSALHTQRNILIFSLVAVPLFAEHFQNWLDNTSYARLLRDSAAPAVTPRWTTALSILLLLPLLIFVIPLKRTIYVAPNQENSNVPMKAVEYMRQQQITGNTFTVPNIWGGYLIWALPSNPVYIDGRNAYPQEFVQEYVEIIYGLRDWREPFDRYGVKNAIVSPRSVLARELRESGEWRQVFHDSMAVVFVR
jgi:hypothetical protein